MVNTPQDLLLQILKIIDYSDNKEAFVEEFIKNIHLQSLSYLISTLSPDKQEEVKTELTMNKNNSDKVASTLNAYFSQSQMQDALKNASKSAMTEYIKTINPTLSATQKQQLSKAFQKLQP
ncbi:Uncharacterised protein [uncultured archaeon]|nr:Uncharacterised protein [uncultured archaeon]